MVMPSTDNEEPQQLVIPVVSVSDENSIMTPGELRQVSLEYELFQSILQSGSTFFGCVNSNECSSGIVGARGALVSLLLVKGVEQGSIPRVLLECRCSSRLAVLKTTDEIVDAKVTMARVERVRDHQEDSFSERREVSCLEWSLWNKCKEVSGLVRKLQSSRMTGRTVDQELAVWAPRAYDREIEEHEWEATPAVTRRVFWDRAECFSFGILRCMEGNEDVARKAREITRTSERLRMALAFVQEKKAVTCAQLSLKKALD
ncbi:hypothetical protein FGB62_6g143 [Gracilaria domingensis]|nr:hypothetical protein FGB62_6g143 [Gracilaria domingensis]